MASATLPARNRMSDAEADNIASDPRYITPLTADERPQFDAWKAQNAPKDSGYDYDLQGAFKAGMMPDPATGHWDDRFKKPNEPTFSTFSQYAKDRPDRAGTWNGNTWVPPAPPPVPMPRPDMTRGGQALPVSGGTGSDSLDNDYAKQVQTREQQNSLDSVNQYLEQQGQAAPQTPDQPIISQPTTQGGEDQPPAPGIASKAMSVVKDIGKGLGVEAVPAVLMGGEKAIQSTVDLVDSSLRFIEDKLGIPQPGPEATPHLPDLTKYFNEPTTVTGRAIEGIAQFLTGWRNAGKQLRNIITAPTTTAGRIIQSAAQGAVTGFEAFDGQEGKLGDALYKVGVPHNVLTDFLATHPDDNEAMGRFRQAVGTVITGVPLDGILTAVQAMRAARAARAVASPPSAPGLPPGTPLVSEAQIAGGNASKPLVTRVGAGKPDDPSLGSVSASELADPSKLSAPAIAATAREAGTGTTAQAAKDIPPLARQQAANDRLYINFARINTPDDIKAVIADTTDALRPEIDASRRGVRSFQQMTIDASHLDAWEALKNRQAGEVLTPEENIAARELWATSGKNLIDLAKASVDNPTPANVFNFRRSLALHHSIEAQVVGARTEAARALAVWRIPVGSDALRAQQINNLIRDSGGLDTSQELAVKVAALQSDPAMLSKFMATGVWAKTRDTVLRTWINFLLSGPKTHIVNVASNAAVALMQVGETATARSIARLLGDDQGVQAGETMAQLYGLIQGTKDGLVNAGQLIRHGESSGMQAIGMGTASKAGDALEMASSGPMGRMTDALETVIGGPGRLMGAEDAYFKTIGYRAELNRQAARMAGQEANAGTIRPDQLKGRIADIMANPPDAIKLESVNAANYATFNQTPGRLAGLIAAAKGQYPALNLLLPFTRTPANILNFAVERSPLAPLLSKFRGDFAAGGARRELALAKMAAGTGVMQVTADLALNGIISGRGPANPQTLATMKRAGWQAYSVHVGDRWYAYNRFDPLGMTMGQAADMVELLHNTEWDPKGNKDMENVVSAVALSVANNALNKTYMQGLSQFMAALNDPERAGVSFWEGLAGSLVPTGVADVNRTSVDSYQREVSGMLDAIRSRTPGLSTGLAPRYDMWGRPVTYDSGLGWAYNLFSPIYSRRDNPEPIDREILHQGWQIQEPSKTQGFNGVNINLANYPHVWSYWKWLQGQGVKDPAGFNQLNALNGMINGSHPLAPAYQMRTDGVGGGKQGMVADTIAKYRQLAGRMLLSQSLNDPKMPASVKGELSAFRAEYRQRAASQPAKFQGQSPPPAMMPPESTLP